MSLTAETTGPLVIDISGSRYSSILSRGVYTNWASRYMRSFLKSQSMDCMACISSELASAEACMLANAAEFRPARMGCWSAAVTTEVLLPATRLAWYKVAAGASSEPPVASSWAPIGAEGPWSPSDEATLTASSFSGGPKTALPRLAPPPPPPPPPPLPIAIGEHAPNLKLRATGRPMQCLEEAQSYWWGIGGYCDTQWGHDIQPLKYLDTRLALEIPRHPDVDSNLAPVLTCFLMITSTTSVSELPRVGHFIKSVGDSERRRNDTTDENGLVELGPFVLFRLTSSNDSLMNGQERTERPTWLRRQLGSGCKVALPCSARRLT
ncbi:hypothetical protein EAI_16000 [Harpegnathos saltator]|uniref:Uncharacterized protein n=1 Tax=Harpegnathos saltator TaxID=610380 RepID=E2BG48_HARSA|nr:hypothetical protein EAI_16000 [Harpegnathos saltator]